MGSVFVHGRGCVEVQDRFANMRCVLLISKGDIIKSLQNNRGV